MKNFILLLVLASVLGSASAPAQTVVLQDFSITAGPNTSFYGTWELAGNAGGTTNPNAHFVQGAGVFDFTGTTPLVPTNDAGSKVEFFNVPLVSIGANTSLAVSAQTLGTNLATSFMVTLFDDTGKTAFATFATSDFTAGGYITTVAALNIQSGFNSASIDSMRISGNQPSGTDRFNLSFNDISAVSAIPESGTCAALAGIFALGFTVWRRRTARP